MLRVFWHLACLSFVAACFQSRAVTCADGTICPPSNVCAGSDVGGGCLDPELCPSAADGTACAATGACLGGTCVAAACGNGRVERDEQCDDGNLQNHDGCSSGCISESPAWKSSAAPQPPASGGMSLAYDRMRGRILLFGICVGNQTWEWDGATWTKLAPGTSPSARCEQGMAYDDVHRRMIVFGGASGTTSITLLSDTWSWDGTTWTPVATTGPSAREEVGMAFDHVLGRVVLFGGVSGAYTNDTWSWDGTAWGQLATATRPPSRTAQAMASDPAGHRVVLFGGYSSAFGDYADTWVWDAATWSQLHPATSPSRRTATAFALDDQLGIGLLYGGTDGTGGYSSDTWMFANGTWQQVLVMPAPVLPTPRMAYDPIREEFVLAGHDGAFATFQTWSFRWSYPGEPDETCIAGQDGDGDGLSGCGDPDCWALCTPFCPPGASGCDPNAPHCGDGQCNDLLEKQVCPEDCP